MPTSWHILATCSLLFLLVFSLGPPIDSPDFRYLNHGHAPFPNPLKRHLTIEQYNEVWFSDPPTTARPAYPARITQPTVLLDVIDVTPFPSLAFMEALPADPATLPPISAPYLVDLDAAIAASLDKLFFISYVPADTARPRWYLVRVDPTSTASDPDCDDLQYVDFQEAQEALAPVYDSGLNL
jgi:hypothetical protein